MNLKSIIELSMLVLQILHELGINLDKLEAIRAQAKAEGRAPTDEELQSLVDDFGSAIDRLREP